LPLRFGAVLTSEVAVAEELLAAHHEQFAYALEQLDGRAEFVVRGRYLEQVVLAEVLSENKQAARLRGNIQDKDPTLPGTAGSRSARSSATRSRPSGSRTRGLRGRPWTGIAWPASRGSQSMS
jgi:hypothetical protein